MRISDWSAYWCSSDLLKTEVDIAVSGMVARATVRQVFHNPSDRWLEGIYVFPLPERSAVDRLTLRIGERVVEGRIMEKAEAERAYRAAADNRSEEHTSELQSLMRISSAVFCLKKQNKSTQNTTHNT